MTIQINFSHSPLISRFSSNFLSKFFIKISIKNKNGELLTSREEVLDRWVDFYEDLYADDTPCEPLNVDNEQVIPPIMKSEIETSIKKLKSGKRYAQSFSKLGDQCSSIFLKSSLMLYKPPVLFLKTSKKLSQLSCLKRMTVQNVKTTVL